jgi:hypothetical protein
LRLLFVLACLPFVYLVQLVLSPLIGGVGHVIFYLEHLHSFYGAWASYAFGVLLIFLTVFGLEDWRVLIFGLVPVVAYCWWMTT